MSALKNDTFLRALQRQPTEYTPLWLMRQAGRYLPEYNATRARAGDFLTLCKTPDLATEVTLQPLARYPLDAAILFSDILTVPDAMGLGLYFSQGEGPRFERPLRDEWEIRDLTAPDPTDKLGYVMDAVRSIRRALDGSVPLIGFSGSPYTLACYMVEGGGSDDYRHIKTMLYSRPDLLHRILEVNTRAVIDYLNAQIEAGAQAVMIFDSWGGSLTPHAYQRILARLHGAHRRRPDQGTRRPPRPQHHLHQGRRQLAGSHGRYRRRRGGAGLDRSTSARRAAAWATRLRCRATSTPAPCTARPTASAPKSRASSTATATTPATCSTSATAFRSSPTRTTSACWSRRCTAAAAPCAQPDFLPGT